MSPLLHIDHLSVDFITEGRTTHAVQDLSLTVHRGEIVALVGESGSGKSVTSLSILQLLPQPPARYAGGRILFADEGKEPIDLLTASGRQLQALRGNRIAMIFQEPMTSLNPVMSCGKQVMEALMVHRNISSDEARKQTIAWFQKVRLPQPETLFDRYPHQLSGGQKQRVMIAMAMCCEPALLICDEPTTALDVTVQKTILELIQELQREQNMGVIFITHDLGVVAQIADRVAIMYKGALAEEGEAKKIFHAPDHPYTRALIACRPAQHRRGERLPVVSDFLDPQNREEETTPAAPPVRSSAEVLMRVENLTVRFTQKTDWIGRPKQFFTAVDGVSFDVLRGETLGLVGESGCGKTTLGRTLLGLIPASGGSVRYKDREITQLRAAQFKGLRKEVQLVFQDPYSSLNPRLTIGAAIAEPMGVNGVERNSAARKKRVGELLERVNLSPSMMNRYPHEFSGGQRQRIVIARALALEPDFLVCDESVSALDVSVQAQVLNLLNELKRDLGLTMLFISHDLSVVRYMCDCILVMSKGAIVERGPADEVYYRPQHAYTKNLIDAIPSL